MITLIIMLALLVPGCGTFLLPNGLFPTYYDIAYDVALKDCEARKSAGAATYEFEQNCLRFAAQWARTSVVTTMRGGYPSVFVSTPTSLGTVTSAW